MAQAQPYLPITCEEFSLFQEDDTGYGIVDWPSQKLRILGKLIREIKEADQEIKEAKAKGKKALRQVYHKLMSIPFTSHDKMYLESIGEPKKILIPLDFSLVPEKVFTFDYGDIVQIMGECLKILLTKMVVFR